MIIYRCDGCKDDFKEPNHLNNVELNKDYSLCKSCIDRLENYIPRLNIRNEAKGQLNG